MEKTTYLGWKNCYRLAAGGLEVIATADVGPRIVYLGTPGGENLMGSLQEQAGLTGGDEWRLYGGHRLWHSPEVKPRTYYPDNEPVEAGMDGDTLRLIPPLEKTTGIQKQIDLTLVGDGAYVEVRHVLENKGLWTVELAPWALTVLNLEGVAIIPQSDWRTADDLLPNRNLTLWPYSDMRDPRITWGSRYIMLRQDPGIEQPFKVGLNSTAGWAAYYRRNQLLVKCFDYEPDAIYPDGDCSVETYTSNRFLELETLGPLTLLEPGDMVEHMEYWFVFPRVEPVANEEDADRIVRPLAEEACEQIVF